MAVLSIDLIATLNQFSLRALKQGSQYIGPPLGDLLDSAIGASNLLRAGPDDPRSVSPGTNITPGTLFLQDAAGPDGGAVYVKMGDGDLEWLLVVTTPSGNLLPHSSLSGLSADDHTQYLLADGTRQLSANWDVGGVRLTNASNPSAQFDLATKDYVDIVTNPLIGPHGPGVQNTTALRAVDTTSTPDKQVRLVEDKGALYAFDSTGVGVDDDDFVIDPTVGPGRWFKVQAATQDHGTLIGLGDDDHIQYLLVDGTRAMSGNFDLANNQALNFRTENLGIVPAAGNVGRLIYDTAAQQLKVDDGAAFLTVGFTDHGLLSGLADNDHPQYRNDSLSYTADLQMGGFNIDNVRGLFSDVVDGAAAVALVLDTVNALNTTGADLLHLRNQGTDVLYIDKDGNFETPTNTQFGIKAYQPDNLNPAFLLRNLRTGQGGNSSMLEIHNSVDANVFQLNDSGDVVLADGADIRSVSGAGLITINWNVVDLNAGTITLKGSGNNSIDIQGILINTNAAKFANRLALDAFATRGVLFHNTTGDPTIFSDRLENASATAYHFDTDNDFVTVGSKLFKISNKGVEKLYIDKDGSVVPGTNNVADLGSSSKKFKDGYFAGKLTVDGLIDPTGLQLNPQASDPMASGASGVYVDSTSGDLYYRNASDDLIQITDGSGLPAPSVSFLNLTDSPSVYIGQGSKLVAVNSGATALEFITAPSGTFDGLTDTPATYVGQAGKVPIVNPGETALIYTDFPSGNFLGLTDSPASYSGQAGLFVKVNVGETGLEFSTVPSGVTNFLALTDTPSVFTSQSLKAVRVNVGETALEFFTVPIAPVTSVAGKTGVVTLDTDDISEATNLYYTEARVDANTNVAANTTHRGIVTGNPHAIDLLDLGDTPANYTGHANKLLAINVGETGVEFIAAPSGTFAGLTDTPANFTGQAGKVAAVNGGETALEFIVFPSAPVTSVAGKTGVITLDTDDISEATNLYYTEGRVDANTNVAANTSHRGSTSNPHSVTKTQISLGNVENLKVNLIAVVAPAITDDSGSGYAIGSIWVDVTGNKAYMAVDVSVGAAIWFEITSQGLLDHGALTGLADDDHTQYSLASGTRAFTGVVSGITPTASAHLTTKGYVDGLIQGLDWQESVLDKDLVTAPGAPTTGDRYIIAGLGGAWSGFTINDIVEWNGASWDNITPTEGAATWVEDEDVLYVFNATSWVQFGSTSDHGSLIGLGDDDHTQYLLVDGTRSMTGGLNMGTQAITNVGNVDGRDVSADGSTLDTHLNGGINKHDASEIDVEGTYTNISIGDLESAIGEIDTILITHNNHLNGGTSKHDATEIDYERLDASKKNIQATSDNVELALTDLDDAVGALAATPSNYTPSDATIIADHLSGIDTQLGVIGSPPTAFPDLTDTPANYTGQSLKAVRVNAGETALEFIAFPSGTFAGLTDTPANYTGQSLKAVRVNVGETALEFIAFPTAPVTSVAGKTGVVTLDTDDITEATNLYYTEARVNANVNVAAGITHRNGGANKHDATEIDVEGTYGNIPAAPSDLETVIGSINTALGAGGGGSSRREIFQISTGTNPPAESFVGSSLSMVKAMKFSASLDEDVLFQFPVPDNCDITADINIIVKYAMSTNEAANNVKLDLEYIVANPTEDIDPAAVEGTDTNTFAPGSGAETRKLHSALTIANADVTSTDATVIARLTRSGSNIADTHGGELWVFSLEINYTAV